MRVLVIPEDFRNDQYILEPIIAAMLRHLGRSKDTVVVCRDPLLRGVDQALRWDRVQGILSRYRGMVDLFLLCVDRDGQVGRKAQLTALESRATETLPPDKRLMAENAWQEVEVWLLAGHELPPDWDWGEVRAELHPKERYFLPLAKSRNLLEGPGEGRKTLGREAARRYGRIRARCPEDVAVLEECVRRWLGGSA